MKKIYRGKACLFLLFVAAALVGCNSGGSDGVDSTNVSSMEQTSDNTIKCKGFPIGSYLEVDGKKYKVVDNDGFMAYSTYPYADLNKYNICTTNVTVMDWAFYLEDDAPMLNYPDMSTWDTSNVTSMNYMLIRSIGFNQDLSHWSVDQVSDGAHKSFASRGDLTPNNFPKFKN